MRYRVWRVIHLLHVHIPIDPTIQDFGVAQAAAHFTASLQVCPANHMKAKKPIAVQWQSVYPQEPPPTPS